MRTSRETCNFVISFDPISLYLKFWAVFDCIGFAATKRVCVTDRARGADVWVGGLMRRRKPEHPRGVQGHAPRENLKFKSSEMAKNAVNSNVKFLNITAT